MKGILSGENEGLSYTLTADGVLTVSGEGWLYPAPAPDAEPCYDDPDDFEPTGWSAYTSEFVGLDFHTAVIEKGIRCLDSFCFRDCRNLKKVILPEGLLSIYADFAQGSPLEYFEEEGLLFLGTTGNPRYVLMGGSEKFNRKKLVIPEGTATIAHAAFWGKEFIEELEIPSSLESLGRMTFAGTSIRHLFLPEGAVADPEWILAFDSAEFDLSLQSLSFPMSMHGEFLKEKDWYLRLGCDITFRKPDGTVGEFYPWECGQG